jgi:hypothetical protein
MSGHSKSDPARQSPVSIPSGIVDPFGSVRSVIDITLRYSRTAFACLSFPVVILGIALKRSVIELSLCLWSDGVNSCTIQIVPSISNSLSHLGQVACSDVVNPDCIVLHHWG